MPSDKSSTYDHTSSVVAHCTKLVHPSSIFTDFSHTLLSLPLDVQSNQRENIIQFLREQLPKIGPNYHSVAFWSCIIHFLLLDNKEPEACKMLILASCIGVEDIESLLVDRKDLILLSLTATKLKELRNQSLWSELVSHREKFSQSKLLRVDCNKCIEDDNLWKGLFELYKAELDRLSQCQTSQHIYRLYQAVLEHFDTENKTLLAVSEAEWSELSLDLVLFTLRKALIKFSKPRNKLHHLYSFAHQLYENLKHQSTKYAAAMHKFLASFIQNHVLRSSFNVSYRKDQSLWILLSNITSSMHGERFDSVSKQEATQCAKEICDLGAKQLAGEGIVPHLLVNESAMLSLKITGQPASSREVFAFAVEKYPTSIELWLSFAQFERTIRQFKQAVTVYEKALAIKQVSSDPAVWRDYIQFSLQREKLGNARSIYIRSLGQVDSKFVDAVWDEFLDFENTIRKKQAGDQPPSLLTLPQLKQAVFTQQPSLQTPQPEVTPQPSQPVVIQEPSPQSSPPQKNEDNAGTLKREGAEIDNVSSVKKPKTETSSPEEPRLELPTSYAEQRVEALPAYVQPSAKFQRPAFRTPENRPSQHSDNLSIESPYVEALIQPSPNTSGEEKPVFGAAPRTLASVGGTLTLEQLKLLEDAQKLLLQRQDSHTAPQPANEVTNAPTPVNTNAPVQPSPPSQPAPQASQPDTSHLPPLLIQLSEVLQDPLIFDIVKSLQNIQILKEKEIQKGRHELKMHQRKMRDQLLQHHRELLNQASPTTYHQIHSQNTQQLRLHEQSCREELAQYDKKAAEDLERQTLEQQRILQQAGVPGFFPSTNKADIELHSQLLKLILSLAQELEMDQNPTATHQRLHAQMQSPPIVEAPVQQALLPVRPQPAMINAPITMQPVPIQPQLPPQLPMQSQIPQLPLQPQLPQMQPQSQSPLDLLAAILAPSQPMQPLLNIPNAMPQMQPVVQNTPQLSVQQITQMIGNLISNTPAHAQGELIQQIQGFLPMLPTELQSHILQTLIATLQTQQNTAFQPLQPHPDPGILLANAMGVQLNPPMMGFPPNDTIVLHGAQGPMAVPLSMLNQLNMPHPPNMNQPPQQQPRNPRQQNYQKRRF